MSRTLLLSVTAVALFGLASVRADEEDPIKARLDKEKAAYDGQVEKLRAGLLKSLQDKEDTARKDGNRKLVEQVKGDREAFEGKGELPKSVPTAAYTRTLQQARLVLEAAFATAIKEYTKAKKDDEAAAVEQQLTAFRADAGGAGTSAEQVLTKGSVWNGRRRTATSAGKFNETAYQLRITANDGKTFKGKITIDETRTYTVEGTTDSNKVAFKTEKKGKFQHTYEGRLRGRVLELAFAGTGVGGEQVKGLVVLALAPAK
jgi:hypothetical protein